jgi:WD40 repeat protein
MNLVYAVVFSPDGATTASGSHDGTIKLWDIRSRRCVSTMEGGGGSVNAVVFSPDGRILASGDDYHTVKLWSLKAEK